MRERERYEEENFTRLPQSKRDKLIQKRLERGEMPFGRLRKDYINKILESVRFVVEVNLCLLITI